MSSGSLVAWPLNARLLTLCDFKFFFYNLESSLMRQSYSVALRQTLRQAVLAAPEIGIRIFIQGKKLRTHVCIRCLAV